ncbi:hypothetical protein [Roseivirga pacifica]|uniref:hypothetical protein n=1 Tax=Roseivirga pacifica TaxID=1267423 RepID=UPI002094AEEF|nr:hypothetical protein [Roseivirga pacifica]MCO6357477.1 hypothetical protein [Roseivirga pacifica]MCO6367758.1 hypothetical protein [Roseivirga pacifica]MCO6369710.1 hypothetical protein [Roseivirga pacifica]MCO6373564.1 hypothetical protein [Roseivirga pacifica]MCO6377131.1 hypothetical protein [Roseivirga pacifica]
MKKDKANKEGMEGAKKQPSSDYFSSFTDKVMNRVAAEEASFLKNDLLRELPFTVPEGYFEQFGSNLEASGKLKQEAKVIQLFQQNWLKYAASIAIIFTLGFLLIQSNSTANDAFLSDVSDESILGYLSEEGTSVEELIILDESMQIVLDDMLADVASNYEDVIDYDRIDVTELDYLEY